MDTIQAYGNDLLAFLREGFNHVNVVKGLVIAMIAAYFLPQWKRLWALAAGALLAHLTLDVMIPVLANHAPFKLPALLSEHFWRFALSLYVGYLLVISVFFVIKKTILGGSRKSSAASH